MSSPAKNQPHTPTLNSLLRQPSAITTPGSSNAVIGSSGPNASQPPGPSATANAIGGNVPGPGYGAPYSPGPGPVVGADPSIQQQQPPPSQPPQMQSDAYYNHRIGLKGSAAPGNNYVPDGMHGGRYPYPTPASPFQQPPIPPPHHQQPPPPHGYYGGPDKAYPSISGYPQPGVANGPSPHSPRTAAPAAGQLHGQNKHSSTAANPAIPPRDHEPMVNGIPPSGKGATLLTGSGSSQGDSSSSGGPKHPSVTALRQEANTASSAGMRNASPSPVSLAAPSSPASLMRHSPVSPTPVSVYNQAGTYHGQPAPSGGHFVPQPQQQPPQQQPMQQQPPPQHPGFYDGNYHYGGYGHAAPGVHQGGPPGSYTGYTGSTNYANGPVAGPSNAAQPYYGHQQYAGPPGSSSMPPAPNAHPGQANMPYSGTVPPPEMMAQQQNPYYGQQMKTAEQTRSNESRTTNGPMNAYPPGMPDGSRVTASPAVAESSESGKDPNRNGSGTPNVDNRNRTATPATPAGGKLRVNGAKESHPSTPVPASPGGASAEDVDSSLSSPSWPRTPMSPALRNQPPSMGPPASMLSGGSGTSGSSKDGGASLVARLLGDPAQVGCTPQEWNERKSFYERLVMYCESNGHPITAQPTVSKQTVDLYRLYAAVRQKGGFEEVTRAKGWKEHCHLANLPFTSSASYQLRKHYTRYLLPYECHFDRGGVQTAVVMAAVESKKKSAKNAAAKAQSQAHIQAPVPIAAKEQQQPPRLSPPPPPQQPYHVENETNLCTMFGISQSNSASGQLKKQYSRFLFPFECYFDMQGVDPQPILASLESKKKSKAKAAAAAAAAAAATAGQGMPPQQQQSRPMFPQQPQQQQHQPQQQQQQYAGDSFMGPPAVPYPGPNENAAMPPSGQTMPATSAPYPGHHGQQPAPPQYPPTGAPYMQMQHPRAMAPQHPNVSQHQQPPTSGSEIVDDRGQPTQPHGTMSYYPQPGAPPVPSASPSTAPTAYNQQKPTSYPGGYPNQMPSTANVMPTPDASRMHQGPSRDPMTPGDGQTSGPQVSYASTSSGSVPIPQQSNAPAGAAPQTGAPSMATAAGQGGYMNQMASPNGSGYQPMQYSHDAASASSAPPPPPNQYLTPQGPRYHGPVSSAATSEAAPASGMISHAYRSNVPAAMSYGQGMYSGPPQASSASSYMPQPQQGENSVAQTNQMASHGGYPVPPSGDGYNTQAGASYPWPQRYPPSGQQPMGPQRFPPGAGYPPSTSMAQQNADYSRMARSGQPPYVRPNSAAYPTGPSAVPYGSVPPNMSLRQDLGMKSLPTGAPQYPPASMVPTAVKKELSPMSAFPPGSVEATTFSLRRRRKLMAKDAGSVEAWRLVMALRCGLQAETTWALNSLNILLYDDSSVMYFGLASLPGLLETLVEHWRRSLMDILGDMFVIDEVRNAAIRRRTGSCMNASTSDQNSTCSMAMEHEPRPNCTPRKTKFANGKVANDEAVSAVSNCILDALDLVMCYESGLWHRGGGACTEHLKFRADETCDEYYLNFGRARHQSSSEKGQCWSRRKRDNKDDAETASKRRRLSSTTMADENAPTATVSNSAGFFFSDRRYEESDEIESHNNLPLQVVPMTARQMMNRCLSISNIIRGLSFIPGNEVPMSKHAGLLRVLAELLLMCHKHVNRASTSLMKNSINEHTEEDGGESKSDVGGEDSAKSETLPPVEMEDPLWFWDNLLTVIDDAFVILCNLSTHLDLYERSEHVSLRLLDALLHWAVCRSPTANDPLVAGAYVSPQKYAVEILCKLSVQEKNVDLLLATPPWERIEFLLEQLSSMLMMGEEIMMREFAVVLVHALCSASPVACAAAALKTKALQQLVIFLEQADANMHQVVQSHGMQALRDNPELIGTSVGMLRRAASSLLFMAKLPACHPKFNRFQQRLLHFTMSHLMDSRVAATVAEALYELQKGGDVPTINSTSAKLNGGDISSSRSTKNPSPAVEASTSSVQQPTPKTETEPESEAGSKGDQEEKAEAETEASVNEDSAKTVEETKTENGVKENESETTSSNGDTTEAKVVPPVSSETAMEVGESA